MLRNDRQRRRRSPIVEGLESRHLLNAALPSPSTAEVHALRTLRVPPIKGVIHGTVTSTTPISATSEVVAYTAQGSANLIGNVSGTGQHTVASRRLRNGSTADTYTNGSATVTGATDTISVSYTGSGRTNANGNFTATLRGTAQSIAGANVGLHGSFTAQLSGNTRTGSFTISFTIQV